MSWLPKLSEPVRNVFNLFLIKLKLSMCLIVNGNVFHSLGAAAMNARSPIVAKVLKLGKLETQHSERFPFKWNFRWEWFDKWYCT